MIKMVIADDESVIIKGIQKLIDWPKYGITIEGSYQDGKSALDGIIKTQADIALLDISMPKLSGVDILKELNTLGVHTKVVFISGFQEFEYAKAAIQFGAMAYILKPIIRQELIDSIQKCIEELHMEQMVQKKAVPAIKEEGLKKLTETEETTYVPALLHIVYHKESRQERKLIQFSVTSCIEKKLEIDNRGIIFSKNNHQILVFKGLDREELNRYLLALCKETLEKTRYQIGLIVGREVGTMGGIPAAYKECQDKSGWFFFMSEWKNPFIFQESAAFHHESALEDLEAGRKKLMELMVKQDREGWEKQFTWYRYCIAAIAAGNREDAGFHFCTGIRVMQDYLGDMGIKAGFDMRELLETGRDVESFDQMAAVYKKYYCQCYELVAKSAEKNDNKPVMEAKKYIEEHYQENLSLDILAGKVHMNAYYFSSFFKKNTGMNYKEYLNEVRLKHAVSLMLSSDKNVSEIANDVGFCDVRSFTKAFSKKYDDTPGNYKKRLVKGIGGEEL